MPASNDSQTVAVFGGTFDPPHVAHVLVAAYVLSAHPVDRLLVVPTFEHPLDKRPQASFEHRLRMCELAFENLRHVEISPIERELGGESRTLRMLEAVKARLARANLRLVLGQDLSTEVHRWHRFDLVEKLAPPIFVGRAGHGPSVDIELPRVSSTEIRKRLSARETTETLLPTAVRAYIDQHDLYRDEPEVAS